MTLTSGGSHTEVIASTTLAAGTASYVPRTSGTAVLGLAVGCGVLAWAAAAAGDYIATTNNLNDSSGYLGTWATIGADWAMNSADGPNGPITRPKVRRRAATKSKTRLGEVAG